DLALPVFVAGLKQDDEDVRAKSALALGVIGLRARHAVPALIELLKDDESKVRAQAVKALAQVARDNVTTVPALVGALGDRQPMVRAFAAMALRQLGKYTRPAVAPLVAALEKEADPRVQGTILVTLMDFGPEAAPAAGAVAKLLTAKDTKLRAAAATALG